MIASTPSPPYTAVIFTSQRTADDDAGYGHAAEQMERLAAGQPGYLGVETARGADGFGITAFYWATAEHARAWTSVIEHRQVQRLGRAQWYASYRVRVCTVEHDY